MSTFHITVIALGSFFLAALAVVVGTIAASGLAKKCLQRVEAKLKARPWLIRFGGLLLIAGAVQFVYSSVKMQKATWDEMYRTERELRIDAAEVESSLRDRGLFYQANHRDRWNENWMGFYTQEVAPVIKSLRRLDLPTNKLKSLCDQIYAGDQNGKDILYKQAADELHTLEAQIPKH
jgi:hypothetical protein